MSQQLYYNSFEGQSLYDVAAAVYGDASLAIDLAIGNNLSVTQKLSPGQKIAIVEGKITANVLQVYKSASIIPATAESHGDETTSPQPGGINYMQIGTSFIVS